MALDPFGRRPKHETGRRTPDRTDEAASARASEATTKARNIWIDHEPQRNIIAQLMKYRDDTAGVRGVPIEGRRLSQLFQAGKSATMARLKHEFAERRQAEGLPPNKYQVIIVELDKRSTLKAFYQEVLKKLDDEYWDENVSAKVLETRIADWVIRLEVELLVADEVQHLDRKASDASEVTDRFKILLDRGVVPLVLVGDEESVAFFRKNTKLAARLGRALRLEPLDVDGRAADAKLFAAFCRELDHALVACGAIDKPAGLDGEAMLDALLAVSGGHVGRVARLVKEALPEAVWRRAERIEAYDLSGAVREYAVEVGWVDHDPFSNRNAR